MPQDRHHDATEDHSGPAKPPRHAGRPVLIVAFPGSRALPLPILGEPVGREWLSAHGAADPRVSGRHVAFHRHGQAVAIEDLGSHNGTFVNGQRLTPGERVPIVDGTLIRIGRTLLVYREALIGPDQPSPALGDLVAPFGLREVARAVEGMRSTPDLRCVLVTGPTGTGKELLARHIAARLRPGKPYEAINIAAIAPNVFEAHMFGYVAGAFSGALPGGSPGALRAHAGGAVLLDEIGDLAMDLQSKLLRFLENKQVQPVGGPKSEEVDVLVLAATHHDLDDLVANGKFRLDLRARLGTPIELTSLADRPEDLFTVMQAATNPRDGFDPTQVEVEAVERLALADWPGNVRDLQSALRAIALRVPPPALKRWAVDEVLGPIEAGNKGVVTDDELLRAIEECAGNKSKAAARLGMTRAALLRRLKKKKN